MPDHSNHQDFYSFLKNKINCEAPVISQFVANRTITKYNDRIFMNIIRQMNAKIGGDLWRMSFGAEISNKTMLVGIDVCHKGKQSTIGFCATYDPYLCKYYAQAAPQPQKGQEIISSSVLSDYFQRAFQSYKDFNGAMPEHIFIYRDGVGDSMRQWSSMRSSTSFTKLSLKNMDSSNSRKHSKKQKNRRKKSTFNHLFLQKSPSSLSTNASVRDSSNRDRPNKEMSSSRTLLRELTSTTALSSRQRSKMVSLTSSWSLTQSLKAP
jgi:hypothetical protein